MFTQNNNTFYQIPNGIKVINKLPGGIYNLKVDEFDKLFLSKSEEDFILPNKMYGNATKHADRIIKTYSSRKDKNTGIGLIGTQGSGKSLLAKKIALDTLKLSNEHGDGISIIISEDIVKFDLSSFLQSISQPCNVFLDEFEKVFKEESQEKMLTILDGNLVKDKLFTITVNNIWKVNQHMLNRPGRLFYNIQYNGLEEEFIKEYCKDKLDRKELTSNILKTSMLVDEFNFDMLQAIVEELNRYPEYSYKECIEILNIIPASYKSRFAVEYDISLDKINNENIKGQYFDSTVKNPLSEDNWVSFIIKKKGHDTDTDTVSDVDDEQDDNPGIKRNNYSFYMQTLKLVKSSEDGSTLNFIHPTLNLEITAKRKKQNQSIKNTLFF